MKKPILTVGSVPVYREGGAILYATGMAIDWDGSPGAYHPPTAAHPKSGRPPGFDDLRNAGSPGNWWGVVTHNGRKDGKPVVQGMYDPAPGFYVSPTALADRQVPVRRPDAYVDAMTVPYIAIPGGDFRKRTGVRLGDLAVVLHGILYEPAIIADIGPRARIGEGSPALARALHLSAAGHERRDLLYCLLPGTATKPAWPRHADEFHAAALEAFGEWGGTSIEDGVARVRHGLGVA